MAPDTLLVKVVTRDTGYAALSNQLHYLKIEGTLLIKGAFFVLFFI